MSHTNPLRITSGAATWLGRFWVATQNGLVTEIQFGIPEPPHHDGDDPVGRKVARQIVEFLQEDRQAFDVPLDWTVLPPAHRDILRTLCECIHWGDTVTYGELAAMAGYPGAARAAGTACRLNPFAIVAPVHRVIAAGGRLGGFAGRPDLKRQLLAREGAGPFKP